MSCGDFHTRVYLFFNSKFSLLIYLPWKCTCAMQSRVCRCQVTFEQSRPKLMVGCQPQIYSVILAQMWPNLGRTG